MDVHALAVPRVLQRERATRIASPWAVAAIVAVFYTLLTGPGLIGNPYQFINIGRQYHTKGTSSAAIAHAKPINDRIGYDGQFYYFLAVDPKHGSDYMDEPGVIYSRIGYPMTVRALSANNPSVIPYMLMLVNILAAVGGTLAVAFFLKRHRLPPALALLYGFFPGLALAVLRDLTEPMAFALAAGGLLAFDPKSKRRLLLSALLFGAAMLTRETVALFPALLTVGLVAGVGRASGWRERLRLGNFVRAVAFAELAFAPLFVWRHLVATVVLPHTAATQEPFVSGEHHVAAGKAGAAIAALIPFHAIAGQWPWTGEDVTNLFTIFLPALIWAGLAVVVLRRKLTLEPWFVLANVAVFVVFLPTPIAVDYGSLGRASMGVLLAVLVTLPRVVASFGEQARVVMRTLALWSLPFYLVLAILFNALGPKYVW